VSPVARNTISNKRKRAKGGSISGGKLTPIKPVVKTGRNEVKPLISPRSELGLSSGSEEEES
jgi:hypothetical protein